MSLHSYPSAEGSALALIDAIIFSLERAQNRIFQSKALQALKTNQVSDASSNLKSSPTIPTTTTTILSAPSPKSLCKSLLMKNTKCIRDDCNDPLNSKYYLVVFQYTKKMHQQKLKKFVKSLGKKSNKFYKFSLASLEETRALTRFEYNTVSPIGIGNVPIIVSHHVVDQQQIWMGSGSLDVKLRIDTAEFLLKFPHFVADITA